MALLKDLTVYGATRLISDTFADIIYSSGYHHNLHDNDNAVLLAGGGYKELSTLLELTNITDYWWGSLNISATQNLQTTPQFKKVSLGYVYSNQTAGITVGYNATTANGDTNGIFFYHGSGTTARIYRYIATNIDTLYITRGGSAANGLAIESTGVIASNTIKPHSGNTYNLGTNAAAGTWANVYARKLSSDSTLYLNSASATSIIFQINGTEYGRFLQPNGYLVLGTTTSSHRLRVNGTGFFDDTIYTTGRVSLVAKGTPWPQINFNSTAYTGTDYTTINQNEWGLIFMQIPAKKNSDSTYNNSSFNVKIFGYTSSGTRLSTYETYSIAGTLDLASSATYNILTSKNSSVSYTAATTTVGAKLTVKINDISQTLKNTDYRVYQQITTSGNTSCRPILLSGGYNDATPKAFTSSGSSSGIGNQVYASHNIFVKPSTGALFINASNYNITYNNNYDVLTVGGSIRILGDNTTTASSSSNKFIYFGDRNLTYIGEMATADYGTGHINDSDILYLYGNQGIFFTSDSGYLYNYDAMNDVTYQLYDEGFHPYIKTQSTTTNKNYNILFVGDSASNTKNVYQHSNGNFWYNPSTSTLSCTNFTGNAASATTAASATNATFAFALKKTEGDIYNNEIFNNNIYGKLRFYTDIQLSTYRIDEDDDISSMQAYFTANNNYTIPVGPTRGGHYVPTSTPSIVTSPGPYPYPTGSIINIPLTSSLYSFLPIAEDNINAHAVQLAFSLNSDIYVKTIDYSNNKVNAFSGGLTWIKLLSSKDTFVNVDGYGVINGMPIMYVETCETADQVNITTSLNTNSNFYITFANTTLSTFGTTSSRRLYSTSSRSNANKLTFNPSTGTLYANYFNGSSRKVYTNNLITSQYQYKYNILFSKDSASNNKYIYQHDNGNYLYYWPQYRCLLINNTYDLSSEDITYAEEALIIGGTIRVLGGTDTDINNSGINDYFKRIYFGDEKRVYAGEYVQQTGASNYTYDTDIFHIYGEDGIYFETGTSFYLKHIALGTEYTIYTDCYHPEADMATGLKGGKTITNLDTLGSSSSGRNRIYVHAGASTTIGHPIGGSSNYGGNVLVLSNQDYPKPGTSQHCITEIDFIHNSDIYHRSRTDTNSWSAWKKIADSNNTYASIRGNTLSLTLCGVLYTFTPTANQVNSYSYELVIGNQSSQSNINATNPYIHLLQNRSIDTGIFRLYGGTGISISYDASLNNGTITISATNTSSDTYNIIAGGSASVTNTTISSNPYIHLIKNGNNDLGKIQLYAGTGIIISSNASGVITIKSNIVGDDKTVKYTASSSNSTYPILFSYNTSPSNDNAYFVRFNTNIHINPSTKTLTCTNFNGNATSATRADTLWASTSSLNAVEDANLAICGNSNSNDNIYVKLFKIFYNKTNIFPANDNDNSILWIGTNQSYENPSGSGNWTGVYGWQIGFSSDNRIYVRRKYGASFTEWHKLAYDTDISNSPGTGGDGDHKVKYVPANDISDYPLLFSHETKPGNTNNYIKYNGNISVNPSTATISANGFVGNLKKYNTIPTDSTISNYTYSIQYIAAANFATANEGVISNSATDKFKIYYPWNNTSDKNIQILRLYFNSSNYKDIFFTPNNVNIFYRHVSTTGGIMTDFGKWYGIPIVELNAQHLPTLGSSTQPIYINNGKFQLCSTVSIVKSNDCTGNRYVIGTNNTSITSNFSTAYCIDSFYFNNKGSFYTSDINKKYDIYDILNYDVNTLFETENGFIRHFKWKENNEDSYGFIAQELMSYCPEAVNFNNDNNLYSVNYNIAFSKIIGAMFKKIKELQKEINELKMSNS